MSLAPLEGLAERNRDGVLLFARLLLAATFVPSGFGKLIHFAAFADSMTGKGLPLPSYGRSLRWRRSSWATSASSSASPRG
jgi:uncharacterized membrane protein YphA (DoxX/SURF4 family)